MSTRHFRPGLVAIWGVLLALVVVIVVQQPNEITTVGDAGLEPLLTFGEPDLGSIEVLHEARRAAVTRDDEGQWFLHNANHSHAGGAVDTSEIHQASAETADKIAAQVSATAAVRVDHLPHGDRPLDDYGLSNPKTIIAFYGRNADGVEYGRPLAMLYIGRHSSEREAYYATIDDDPRIALIPDSDMATLLELLFGEDQAPTPLPQMPASQDN